MSNYQLILLGALLVAGCDRTMKNDGRVKPLEPTTFFPDGKSARSILPNTVQRPGPMSPFNTQNSEFETAPTFPFEITDDFLNRGQQRYTIYCSVCHGHLGDGNGMIVQRGFTRPPSFHIDRLRNESDRHYYDVITNGWGAMYSYSDRVAPRDRWAIAAYIRALQISQNASPDLVSAAESEKPPTNTHEK